MAAVEMLSESEQIRVITNDHLILDNTTRVPEGGDVALELAGVFFPDGKGCRWIVPELDRTVFMNWCNLVRGEWNERTKRKADQAASKADARKAADGKATADAGVRGGGAGAAQAGVPDGEGSVEAYLQAQVTKLAEAIEFQVNNIEDGHRMVVQAQGRKAKLEAELARAKAALSIYEGGKDASPVRKADSKELQGQTKNRRSKARSKMVRRSDSAEDQQG